VIVLGKIYDGQVPATHYVDAVAAKPGTRGRNFDVEHRFNLAPIRLAPTQKTVALNADHDSTIEVGRLAHLREQRDGSIWAVAELNADRHLPPHLDVYFSMEYRVDGSQETAATLTALALTAEPARSLPPVRVFETTLADLREDQVLVLRAHGSAFEADLLAEAKAAVRSRRFGDNSIVVARPEPEVVRLPGGGYLVDGELVAEQPRSATRQMVRDDEGNVVGPLRFGPPGRVLAVR
jgi:hypothetical protein